MVFYMEEYIRIRKRTALCWVIAVFIAVAAVTVWRFRLYIYKEDKKQKTESLSYNILEADGKNILYFRDIDKDSLFTGLGLSSANQHYGARLSFSVSDLRRIVRKNKKMLKYRACLLDTALEEMRYFLDVHGVQDEGYDMVARHATDTEEEIGWIRKILDRLEGITKESYVTVKRVAVYDSDNGSFSRDVFIESDGGLWTAGRWLKTRRKGNGIVIRRDGKIVRGVWSGDSVSSGVYTDATGTYRGQLDENLCASGHGVFIGNDGAFYEGHWKNDRQDGFGFYVRDVIRAGEWSGGIYKGERLNYTSERIYGIDISRYQHGKGRRYYPIHWNRLRIASLGGISRKHVSGPVDYKVSFVYIKSTEGITVRNPYYLADYRQARRNGIYCGAYHFFSLRSDAAAQARFFIRHSRFSKGDMPPVLDVEPTDWQIARIGGARELFSRVRRWMNIVRRKTGVRPVLYVSQQFVNKYLNDAPDIKRDYNIWIARYGEYKPDIKLVYWQLCPDGKVRGIHGDVDINVFNGYHDQFDKFINTELIK